MNHTFTRPAAIVTCFLAVPLFSVSALADEPRQEAQQEQPSPQAEASAKDAPTQNEAPAAAEQPKEEERICRRIRTDMSSRRATRVCMTSEEWREFNQGN